MQSGGEQRVGTGVYYRGMGTGWVAGWAIPVPTDLLLGERYPDSEAGPGSPVGAGVGGQDSSGVRLPLTTTPCGRARFAVSGTLLGQSPPLGQ